MNVQRLAKLRPMISNWRKSRKKRFQTTTAFNNAGSFSANEITAEGLRKYDEQLTNVVEALLEESELVGEMIEVLEE